MSTTSTYSPFRISPRDRANLDRNEAFRLVREHLRRQELGMKAPSFCAEHRHDTPSQEQETFRLHRDIIHTILLPLFLLHHQASRIATNVLPRYKGAECERAFRGEARGAYAWLHSILSEEHDWYLTERCPACIVLHVMNSEPTIRFVAVACLLSDHLQGLDLPSAKRRLPNFDFWYESLENAVRQDTFWGDGFWPDIEYRACALTDGVKQLVLQCLELQAALDRHDLQPESSYRPTQRSRNDSSRPSVTVKQSSCTQLPVIDEEDQKLFAKAGANRGMHPCRNERPQRFHARRHGDPRRRSVTS
ncbi:hypothetical protein CBS63078_4587 [Aspergillus niger]|uniref:Contig An02c0270, genomic contig n=5 Tax=Aspergillus subgen. Circumdati TaxID=2720871 RepID=A2QE19_ASPNC|nr:uncharacterized protein An02g09040 [Aspergillus niger]XP_025448787.1 uncharacterized protein BO96DRAFT_219708 [Aspergillus niger CBS 101883]XP_026626958.1 hypothetical protein BDQ94DRAFT_142936 [Aspergillus welwitschiae]EHA23217.1 hypothetical protein ASPNIDRAFT_197631 [Aspergillus niger ATCC 1015]RDH19925.1 hypothetical protein M747DRAFT_44034 [Aspergillus niger ATCC 13496]KAI2821387.1 hypothetical protein CBS115989_2865 [Aspergillus niger]KAI2847291.1 hypothetical protein CBS11350_3300 [|eukprot:XP_001400040.1 hypothetical protein ANI_1_1306024 [Aspergillus niger CBS 513.88]